MNNEDFDREAAEAAFENAYDEAHPKFEEISKEKLIISLLGSVNAGKSKTINALTGIKYAEVKARSGWTKEITLYELHKGIFIADTPGLFDIDQAVSQKASTYVEENCDIVLFFLNAAVGITAHEKEAFKAASSLDKSIVVVLNKIDCLQEGDLPDLVEQIEDEIGIAPFPISARDGQGIRELNEAIVDILEKKGKDLLFLKVSKHKEKTVSRWINAATVSAVAIGATPIPGSDIVPLTTLQVGLALKIAFIYGIKPSKNDVMKVVGVTVTGSAGKQIVRWAITALKATGWIPGAQLVEAAAMAIGAIVAGGLTFSFGWTCNVYYKKGMKIDLPEVGVIFKSYYDQYKRRGDDGASFVSSLPE